jgi:MFS family permease
MSRLPRAVWLFGWISLATDAAAEAIYPLLPFFLTRVLGAGALSLGVVEGTAEAVSSVLKIASGRVADRSRSKRPFVLFGYTVSSIARPFIAITTTWPQVFGIRVLDRVGKGVRNAPRDAMLATWTTPETRGRVFGFHRAMDHLGAVVGPTLASLFLFFYPDHYRTLFALTIVPGAIAVILIFFVPEEVRVRLKAADASTLTPRGSALPPEFTRFMVVLTLFTLGNSTDAFLLLRLTDMAGSVKWIPLMWAALHVVKAGVSIAGGSWSDRIGRHRVIAMGWIVYAAVYAGFAVSTSLPALLVWFLVYGFHFGFAEGTEKALVADLAPAERRGFAFGIYNAVQGLGAFAASVIFGVIWKTCGAPAAFWTGAAFALGATALLFVFVRPYNRQHT